jgi:hypothetical protein
MLRGVVMIHLPNMNDLPAMDRYYHRYHGPEIARRFGPWLERFESYRVVPPPPGAERYGYINYRIVESWWREMPSVAGTVAFTTPPSTNVQRFSFLVPPQPTEEFLGGNFSADEKSILRWLTVFKDPETVSVEEGENWYLNVHANEALQQPGLTQYFSYRILESGGLPGHRPGGRPQPARSLWHRLSELWYENFDGWHKSVIDSPPKYTKPPWAKYDEYPFLEPGVDFWSTFILERPDDDFLSDYWRGYV